LLAFEAAKKATLSSAALKQKPLKDQHSKQPFSLPFFNKTTQIPDLADLTYAFRIRLSFYFDADVQR